MADRLTRKVQNRLRARAARSRAPTRGGRGPDRGLPRRRRKLNLAQGRIVEGQESYLMALNPHFPDRIIKMDGRAHICGVVVFSGRER
jgi:hypothetical protein